MRISPYKRLLLMLKPDKRDIRNVYVYAFFHGLIMLTLPLGIQAIVNLIQLGQVNTSWVVLVVLVVLGVALSGVLQIYQLRITENLQQRIFTRAAFEFAHRVPRIRLKELYKRYAPEIMNRFFDTLTVQKGLAKLLIEITTATLQVIFGLVLLSIYHPFFILFSVFVILIIYAAFRITGPQGLRTSLDESRNKYRLVHWLEELARARNSFKLSGNSDLPMNRTNRHVDEYLISRESHFGVLVKQYSLMVFIKVLVALGLLAIGGVLVMEGIMNIGQFVAAEIIILLLMNAIEKLILGLDTIYDVFTALEKIAEVTDLKLESYKGTGQIDPQAKNLEIQFSSVSFSYPGSVQGKLSNLSFNIQGGQKIMLTGNNETGRRAFMHLLEGLYTCDDGHIAINDQPIGGLNLPAFRAIVGDALAEETVFEGTIAENISLGRPDVSQQDLQATVSNLLLTEFIKEQEDGLETIIYPNSNEIPQSVVKKIMIARAVVNTPKLLLVEDTLNGLHPGERQKLLNYLLKGENDWTVIISTHNVDLVNYCDDVFMLDLEGHLYRRAENSKEVMNYLKEIDRA